MSSGDSGGAVARWSVHTLTLDLDDTLYPERDFVLGGFAVTDAWLVQDRGISGFQGRAEALFAAGRRGRIFDEALVALDVPTSPELIARMVEIYRGHAPTLRLFPDAERLLAWAAGRFQLALLTDGYADVQARKIRALGLDLRIACRVISDTLGREHWKPSPAPYRAVMEQLPGRAEGYVYVGDNPRKDFQGARALGWRTVRIRRAAGEHTDYSPGAGETADAEITSLDQLQNLVLPDAASP